MREADSRRYQQAFSFRATGERSKAGLDNHAIRQRRTVMDAEEAAPLLSGSNSTLEPEAGIGHTSSPVDETVECCHPTGPSYRLFFIVLVSFMCFGSQCAYDSIGAAGPFLRKVMNLDAESIGDLYSAYHLPNTFMVIFGGILADRIGTSAAALFFILLTCVGTFITAISTTMHGMLLGRLVFGVGSESLTIVQLSIISRWCSNSTVFPSLAVSMALSAAISSMGTVTAYNVIPLLGSSHVHHALFILGVIPCICSLGAGLLVIFLDEHAIKCEIDERGKTPLAIHKERGSINSSNQPPRPPRRRSSLQNQEDSKSCSDVFDGIRSFSTLYWAIILYVVFFTGATQAWGNFATDMFVEKFHLSAILAGRLTGAATVISVALIIPFGYVIDIFGHRGTMMIVGAVILASAHALLRFEQTINQFFAVILMGIAMAMIQSSVYPSISLAVPEPLRATAFGVCGAAINISMTCFPFLTGYVHDLGHSYTVPMDMFLMYDICCLGLALYVLSDKKWHVQLQGHIIE